MLYNEPANAMCYRKKGSGTIWQRLMHPAALARVFFFLFVFFPTEPENGAVDIQLQIQQEGLLLLARHRASEGLVEKRAGVARHSMARHSTGSALFCSACTCPVCTWACSTFNRHLPRGQ